MRPCTPLPLRGEKAGNKTHKRASWLSRTTLFSPRYTCRLPARASALCRSRHPYVLQKRSTELRPKEGGQKFRSVGPIKERSTIRSIDISEGPRAWYNKAWGPDRIESGRTWVRGPALSVNQGKWFVKGRARACEIVRGCATLRDATVVVLFLRLRLRAARVPALNYKTNFRPGGIEVEEVAVHNNEAATGGRMQRAQQHRAFFFCPRRCAPTIERALHANKGYPFPREDFRWRHRDLLLASVYLLAYLPALLPRPPHRRGT